MCGDGDDPDAEAVGRRHWFLCEIKEMDLKRGSEGARLWKVLELFGPGFMFLDG